MNRRDSIVAGLFIVMISALVITLASFADGFLAPAGYVVGGALGLIGVGALFVDTTKRRR